MENIFTQWMVPIATLILVVVLPYVVNLVKQDTWSKGVKRWVALIFSMVAGIATGLISGVPTPETFITWALAVVGGVQIAYTAFKANGITSGWLDALEGIGSNSTKEQ